jgi:hypothetical protein
VASPTSKSRKTGSRYHSERFHELRVGPKGWLLLGHGHPAASYKDINTTILCAAFSRCVAGNGVGLAFTRNLDNPHGLA